MTTGGEAPKVLMSPYTLGTIAYTAWVKAHPGQPSEFYTDLSEAEREAWQRVGSAVAERVAKHLGEQPGSAGP